MNYNIEYKIADIRSSLGKENNYQYYPDHEFTDENLEKIFEEYSKSVNKQSQGKFEYLRASMPCLDEMKSIVEDILEFYEKNFKVYTSEQEHTITLRFFVHIKFMNENGDAYETSIRVGCKNFAECGNTNASVEKFLDKIPYEKKEYFINQLRLTLAHELYHSLHMRHCSTIKKKYGSSIYENILDEIFANYFAYVYFDGFLKGTEGEEGIYYNWKRNDVIHWYEAARYFGVGRKRLFPKTYSEAEIEQDNQEFQRLMADKNLCKIVDTKNYPVSEAEYSTGYILAFYGKKFEEDKIGKEMRLYFDLYQQYLAGNAKDALLKLMTIKEEKYYKYTYHH